MVNTQQTRLSVYGLDLRSLALFRIVSGLAMFLDVLLFKIPNIADIYSRSGFFAEVYLTQHTSGRPFYLNLFYSLGSDTGVTIFFGVSALVYLFFAAGVFTRVMAPLSLLLFCLTRESNTMIDLTPDLWFTFMLFWAVFLPLDGHFALRGRKSVATGSNECRALPAYLLLAAISVVYFVNGYTKLGGDWFTGDVLRYWLPFPPTRGWGAMWLVEQPTLLIFLEIVTVVWELVIPLLLFSPWFIRPFRWITLISILMFHYGNLLFIVPGYYFIVGTCVAVVLLPDTFWARWFPGMEISTTPSESATSRFASLSPLMKTIVIVRNVVLSALLLFTTAINCDELPGKLGLADGPLGYWQATQDKFGEVRRQVPHVDVLRFLLRRHAYYPADVPQYQKNLVVLGVDHQKNSWNLVTGEPASNVYWGPNPDFRRPYYAMHRGAYFGPENFLRGKVFDRWLAKLTQQWNEAHPDKAVVLSMMGMIELDQNKESDPFRKLEQYANWSAKNPADE